MPERERESSGARPKNIRAINCRSAIDLFGRSEKRSVLEVSDQLGLSKTATINILNLLVSSGLITRCGKGASSDAGGKKPILHAMNPAHKYGIVVSFEGRLVIAEMLDFCLNKVHYRLQETADGSYSSIVQAAAQAINYLLEHAVLAPGDIFAVAVQSGGIVDARRGILLRPIASPDWQNDLPLVADLKKLLRIDVPVYFDNVCRFGGYFELLKNPVNRDRTIMSLYVSDSGVGGSLIQKGEISHGQYGLIGEFGHITTDYRSTEVCKCGRTGCFETVVTGRKVVELARKAFAEAGAGASEWNETNLKSLTDLFSAADAGDRLARSQLDFVIGQFANMLYNMQIMYDPDTVIIQGVYADSGGYFKDRLSEAVEEISLFSIARSLRLVFDDADYRDAVTLGAAYFCREQYLDQMLWNAYW